VADHGDAFLPLYRFCWRDGSWTCLQPSRPELAAVRLDADALWSERSVATPPEQAPEDADLERDRARVLKEAREMAGVLRERWRAAPPTWNPPTGVTELDELAWFRYVEHERP